MVIEMKASLLILVEVQIRIRSDHSSNVDKLQELNTVHIIF